MSAKKVPNSKDELIKMLYSKYRNESEKFRSYLPELVTGLRIEDQPFCLAAF